ncbi:alpha/beta fold hydrolase [Arcanobacterium wilhelmae]|uniref:alpha/beta fold hydrolase n=1 Tax=Arcanobacterium wilhelmae TaxID=1803177 RepID=UPI0027D7733A|nr:alpha/beta hydrolase [Arcanobacterium wilhelmae]
MLLVHGFPEYWWAWRGQLEPLADAGFHAVALDLRGVGGSDKTPGVVDSLTLAEDLVALVRTLGYERAVLVGHGRGGSHAWTAAAIAPEMVEGLVVVSSPHPRTLHRLGFHVTFRTWRYSLATVFSSVGKRLLANPQRVADYLTEWSAPGNTGASAEACHYADAMALPGAAGLALERLRWSWAGQLRARGREYLAASRKPVRCPVLAVRGELDPLLPPRAWNADREFAHGEYTKVQIPHAGHFVHEEQAERFNDSLLGFLAAHQ